MNSTLIVGTILLALSVISIFVIALIADSKSSRGGYNEESVRIFIGISMLVFVLGTALIIVGTFLL